MKLEEDYQDIVDLISSAKLFITAYQGANTEDLVDYEKSMLPVKDRDALISRLRDINMKISKASDKPGDLIEKLGDIK